MKILQIATPSQPTFAAFAVKNKKNAWVLERLPVVFFGLIPITNGPDEKIITNENTIEPLVFNLSTNPGTSIASIQPNFLGIEVMSSPNSLPKDWSKELITYIAINEDKPTHIQNSKTQDIIKI